MEQKKKILLITYYWSPCGGVAVQRWLKMVKYLASDFDVTVYVPLNPEYPSLDNELAREIPENVKILKNKIFEPYGLFRKLTFKKKNYKPKQEFASIKKKSFLDNLSVWIRGNFFIPDARKFWIKPSIRFLTKQIKKESFDVVISNGTPHSVHMIALGLKKKFNFKWIADFRDPWTKVDYFDKLMLTRWAKNCHIRKEKKVLTNADLITTVSDSWAKDFKELGAKNVKVLYNGFDESDFIGIDKKVNSDKLIISHVGSLNEERNKENFWMALSQLISSNAINKEIEIRLVGNVVDSVKKMVEKYNLTSVVKFIGSVSHKESLQEMVNADLLLLFLGDLNDKGRIPAKVFEYIGSNNNILSIAEATSDVGVILSDYPKSQICMVNNENILNALSKFQNLTDKNQSEKIFQSNKYSRKSVSLELKKLIEAL